MRKDHNEFITRVKRRQSGREDFLREFSELVRRQRENSNIILYPFSDYCISDTQNGYTNRIFNESFEPYHYHDYYEINYCAKGLLYQYLESDLHELRAGDFILIPPGVCHSIYSAYQSVSTNLLIRCEYIKKLEHTLVTLKPDNLLSKAIAKNAFVIFHENRAPLIRACFLRMEEFSYQVSQMRSVKNCLWDSLLDTLFYEIICEADEGRLGFFASVPVTQDNPITECVMTYMKNNLSDISVDKISKHFGISAMSLNRMFASVGYGYSDYLATLRISRAKYLLKKTDLKNREIAERVGLESPEYFSRFFRRYVGKSPSGYRKDYLISGEKDAVENS